MIILPWPPAKLSPNARGNWRTKERARTAYKLEGFVAAKETPTPIGNIHLKITFYPPSLHHRDLDNCLASIKYGLDGIAGALKINDTAFRPITIDWGEKVKGGKVLIEFV